MAFAVPNTIDATYSAQAEPDSRDFDAIAAGFQGSGVKSGMAVTQRGAGANLSVDVASGTVQLAGAQASQGSTQNVAVTADATNPRFVLIVANSAGTASAISGTAAAAPVFPTFNPATQILLAAVYVPAGATNVVNANIVDKRVILEMVTTVAGRNGDVTLTVADTAAGTFPTGTYVVPDQINVGTSGSVGSISIVKGDASNNSSMIGFHSTGGTRQGYLRSTSNTSTDTGTIVATAGHFSATGFLEEQGSRVYSPNNHPTASVVEAGTFPGANSYSALQTFNAGLVIPSGQPLTTGTRAVYTGTRSTTTNASDTVNLGTVSSTGGAIELRIHAHLAAPAAGTTASVTKVYEIAMTAAMGTLSTWYKVLPVDASASGVSTNDFDLEVQRTGAGAFSFRFRQKTIGIAGVITFTLESMGDTAITFTPSTTITAAPTAVSTLHPSNSLGVFAGQVGINTDNPGGPFEVWSTAGTVKALGVVSTGYLDRLLVGANTLDSDVAASWQSYSVTWSGATTNPAIGNGSIASWYKIIGKTCFVRLHITAGSTTTFGSGNWSFSLPVAATVANGAQAQGPVGYGWDSSASNGYDHCRMGVSGTTAFTLNNCNPAGSTRGTANAVWDSATPFAWANGDQLHVQFAYEIA